MNKKRFKKRIATAALSAVMTASAGLATAAPAYAADEDFETGYEQEFGDAMNNEQLNEGMGSLDFGSQEGFGELNEGAGSLDFGSQEGFGELNEGAGSLDFGSQDGFGELNYKDVENIKKYVDREKHKILPRRVTGTCAKHQRVVAEEVKKARFMALIQYVG